MTVAAHDDTIAAIASAVGPAARGIIRVSGTGAIECVRGLFAAAGRDWPVGLRQAQSKAIDLEVPGIACGLPATVYVWPSARSFVGQPTVEIHTVASRPLIEQLLAAICEQGARPARPGEFTLRAFLAGRIDLTQAEAVLGVIDAVDRRELDVALRQLAGGLGQPLRALRSDLLDLLADVEAGLDFVEEDIEFVAREAIAERLSNAAAQIERLTSAMRDREITSARPRVVFVGWPNVGKSSLFNAMAGREAAIVADVAGTTRDHLTAVVELDGVVVELIDTAGLAEPQGSIEESAQAAAQQQRAEADVELFCIDAGRELNEWERRELASTPAGVRIVALTKADLPRQCERISSCIATSAAQHAGLDNLRDAIRAAVDESRRFESDAVPATASRCRDSLVRAGAALAAAAEATSGSAGDEIVAGELRLALEELGEVVGAVYTEDLLDRIFGRFCIGK